MTTNPYTPPVSAALQAAIEDGGEVALQIVLQAALARNDTPVIAYCLQIVRSLQREKGDIQ